MSVVLLVSIVIRLLAVLWSLRLLRGLADWRIVFLSAMLALMALRQMLTVATEPFVWGLSATAHLEEIPGLVVSVLAFLALIFLGRMIRDERERNRQLESAVRQEVEERLAALMANAAKDKFLANASHQLRTPLNAIIGFSEIIRRESKLPPESVRQYAGLIHESGEELLQTVNDILDIAATDSGAYEGKMEPVDVSDLLTQILSDFDDVAAHKSITLAYDGPVSPAIVACDGRALRRIVTHLVANSVKYTETGGSVRLEATHAPDGFLVVKVTDTGIGMPAAFLDRIGEPFLRAHKDAYVADQSGAGLGLAIVKALVDRIGARWHIDSAPGEGTKITVEIPVQPAPV